MEDVFVGANSTLSQLITTPTLEYLKSIQQYQCQEN